MRRVCGEKPGSTIVFIPVSFDNCDDLTPVRITYRVPTERERRKLLVYGKRMHVELGEDGMPAGLVMNEDDQVDRVANALEQLVEGVENYEGRNGAILTGADLAEHGDDKIVKETFEAITSSVVLAGEELKKSSGSSDSPSQTTQRCSETAEIAPPEIWTDLATVTDKATPSTSTSPNRE